MLSRGKKRTAGLKGKNGPPGNMNAFKHGLAAIQKRREESVTTEHEEGVRQQILDGRQGRGSADIDGHKDSGPGLSRVTSGRWPSTIPI
jgi:hypothetical protein